MNPSFFCIAFDLYYTSIRTSLVVTASVFDPKNGLHSHFSLASHHLISAGDTLSHGQMSVKDVFLEWVFPLLGGIVGTLMFMAPLRAVLEGASVSPR